MKGTTVEAVWKAGISLENLINGLADIAARHALTFMPPGGRKSWYASPWGQKPYKVKFWSGSDITSVETDDLISLRPFDDPKFAAIYWELYDPAGKIWFSLSILRENVTDGRISLVSIGFDETFTSLMPEGDVQHAIAKYHQLKELFVLLNADVVRAWSSAVLLTEEEDPNFSSQRFRFAKQGRQIVIAPMEEGRCPRPEEDQQGTFRIVIDGSDA